MTDRTASGTCQTAWARRDQRSRLGPTPTLPSGAVHSSPRCSRVATSRRTVVLARPVRSTSSRVE
ncbi:hypothetical protein [Nocardiopsis sp. TNDT3]|uniref:hypothetical protein n=1 Tax=Nocardiopsis sp. TNDT3 TaxID=2249354 RepID=UPI00351A4C58